MGLNKSLQEISECFNRDAAFVKHIKRESVETRKQEYAETQEDLQVVRQRSIKKSPDASPAGRFSKSPANRMNSYASMHSKDMPSSTISLMQQKSSAAKN